MKKTIYILLAILLCTCLPVQAYEYFTIHFKDGTTSEAFYATDVESISYSKQDLDGMEHADWQVQEIQTIDSLYRIPLADIAYLDFKDVDENVVANDIASVSEAIAPLFNDCKSPLQLSEHLPTIQSIDGVEDAYISNQTLFVKVRDWGYISFMYPIEDSNTDDEIKLLASSSNRASTPRRSSSETNNHQHTEVLKACVVNQQFKDLNRKWFQDIAKQYCSSFASMGIDTKTINMPSPNFFRNQIFDYDVVFIKAHGDYEVKRDLHWLCTGEEIWSYNPEKSSVGDIEKFLKVNVRNWINHGFSSRKISFMCIGERRGEDSLNVFYTSISDEYIRSATRRFKNDGSAIVFNTACESMMKNYKMAEAFKEKGAACYLGYDDANSVGGVAGKHLFAHLLGGKSLLGAYMAIPQQYKEQTFYIDIDGKMHPDKPSGVKSTECNPKLKPDRNEILSICITHPETLFAEEISDGYILKGQMKGANISGIYEDVYPGLQIDTNSDMSQASPLDVEIGGYDPETLYWKWEVTLDESKLQPNTTYYYRAYIYDGYSYCYGEIKSFTTKGGAEAYAFRDPGEDGKWSTLFFYYDNKKNERGRKGRIYNVEEKDDYGNPKWIESYGHVLSKIVIDSTFVNYTPTTTKGWFQSTPRAQIAITTIENLCYLNTSKVTNMHGMFMGSKYLTSLDLSTFDTSKVTNMYGMFLECESLTSLDLSSFDTSNVKNMSYMFFGCSSLTSLDLSSFDTSNVTVMWCMF